MIRRIARDPQPSCLTKLTRVTLFDCQTGVPLELVESFAVLPSMKQIYASKVYEPDDDCDLPQPASKVTHLSLNFYTFEPRLFDFLDIFDSLVALDLGSQGYMALALVSGYNFCSLPAALNSNVQSSLRKLTLRGQFFACIGSFRSFAQLEELDVHIGALRGDNRNTGFDTLRDSLPQSLETLTLRHSHQERYDHIYLASRILKQCTPNGALPQLQALNFRSGQPAPLPETLTLWTARFAAAGISLTLE